MLLSKRQNGLKSGLSEINASPAALSLCPVAVGWAATVWSGVTTATENLTTPQAKTTTAEKNVTTPKRKKVTTATGKIKMYNNSSEYLYL